VLVLYTCTINIGTINDYTILIHVSVYLKPGIRVDSIFLLIVFYDVKQIEMNDKQRNAKRTIVVPEVIIL
jgi:hypothetical protein